jgi:restriction system protein
MARRKSSPLEDLVIVASRLPWWASLVIALLAWVLLHRYATSALPAAPRDPSHLSGYLTGSLLHTLATGFQFIVPIAFVAGAIGSVIGRARRRRLLEDVATATASGRTLENISWQDFERLVGETFRRQGYSVSETGATGPDGGVDLVLHKQGEKYLVQCKQWRALKVGLPVIREFLGAMVAEGAVGGFVVCAGAFTDEAKAFASGRNIKLVDGVQLKRWIAAVKRTSGSPAAPDKTEPAPDKSAVLDEAPNCPICQRLMVKRVAKKGANAGKVFWGCVQWLGCRGIVSVQKI